MNARDRTGRAGKGSGSGSGSGSSSGGPAKGAGAGETAGSGTGPERPRRPEVDPERRPAGGMQRIGDLLPQAARQFGLEQELELATVMSAWDRLIAAKVPAAAGSCRITAFSQGVATVESDEPIVAQELRLRGPELVAALRSATAIPVRQLRFVARHV